MFFIFGISQKEEKLDFSQAIICPCCGAYGRIEVFCIYSYFSLFFIPIFKWNRRYYIKTSCCNSECSIPPELGKAIKKGEIEFIDVDHLNFNCRVKRCENCGYTPSDISFSYCPKCGKKL